MTLKQQHDIGRINVLFTNVLMSLMSSKELAEQVRALYPHIKTKFRRPAVGNNEAINTGPLLSI